MSGFTSLPLPSAPAPTPSLTPSMSSRSSRRRGGGGGPPPPLPTSSSSSPFNYVPIPPPPPPPPPPPTFSEYELLAHASELDDIKKQGKLNIYLTNVKFDLKWDRKSPPFEGMGGKKATFIESDFREMLANWSGGDFVMEFMTKKEYNTAKELSSRAMTTRKVEYTERWKLAQTERKRMALQSRRPRRNVEGKLEVPKKRVRKEKRPFSLGSIYFYKRNTNRKVFAYLQMDGTVFVKGSSGDEYTRQFADELVAFISEKYQQSLVIDEYTTINMCGVFTPHTATTLNFQSEWLVDRLESIQMFSLVDYEPENYPAIHLEQGVDKDTIMLYDGGNFLVMGAKSGAAVIGAAHSLLSVLVPLKVEFNAEARFALSEPSSLPPETKEVKLSMIDRMLQEALHSLPVPEPTPTPRSSTLPTSGLGLGGGLGVPEVPEVELKGLSDDLFSDLPAFGLYPHTLAYGPDLAAQAIAAQMEIEFADTPSGLLEGFHFEEPRDFFGLPAFT